MDRQTRQAIKHDKFLDELNQAYTFAQRKRKQLIAVAIAVAVVALTAAGLAAYLKKQENEAQRLLGEGIEIMQTAVGEKVSGTSTTYDSEQAKRDAAEEVFRRVLAEFGRSDAADVASIYVAQIESNGGEYDAARKRFEAFIDEHPDHLLAGAAEMSLLNIRLAAGEADAVIAELQQRIDEEEGRLPRPVLLALLAQAHELKGNQDEANKAYRRIANEYPDSPYSLDANRKLAQG